MRGWRVVRRWLAVAVVLAVWTYGAVFGLFIITMGVAHSDSEHWPLSATVALAIVGLVWVLVPVLVVRRYRSRT